MKNCPNTNSRIILALCGSGTILNAISGECMLGAASLLHELKK